MIFCWRSLWALSPGVVDADVTFESVADVGDAAEPSESGDPGDATAVSELDGWPQTSLASVTKSRLGVGLVELAADDCPAVEGDIVGEPGKRTELCLLLEASAWWLAVLLAAAATVCWYWGAGALLLDTRGLPLARGPLMAFDR